MNKVKGPKVLLDEQGEYLAVAVGDDPGVNSECVCAR